MATFICKLFGVRGRVIEVYDNKCVIRTELTAGSILTGNSTDGEKTIFYIDCVGVQFKESALAIGYLQLETPSMQMNNQTNNFFSENTFTFQNGVNQITNRLMRVVYQYICDRAESYKYKTRESSNVLYELINNLVEANITVPDYLRNELNQHKKDNEEKLRREKQSEEEAIRKHMEQETQRMEKLRQDYSSKGVEQQLVLFWNKAVQCNKIGEIRKLWNDVQVTDNELMKEIGEAIESACQIERMYGADPKSTKSLLNKLETLIKPEI